MKRSLRLVSCLLLAAASLIPMTALSEPQLLRETYFSDVVGEERDYYVYLPSGHSKQSEWPVLLFLHGNGERGDAKEELGFVLLHGPLFEAWIQKRNLPFIIIAPQLPMYEMGEVDYIKSRRLQDIPQRQADGVPSRPEPFPVDEAIERSPASFPHNAAPEGPPSGWNLHDGELLEILDATVAKYSGDTRRVYLSGLSYGGFGAWWMASRYPQRFAAVNPIVGYPHPDLIDSIAAAALPVWCFAGGRDPAIPVEFFYAGMNKLDQLSSADVRFTVEEDMGHDVWRRVYAGSDIYQWLLSHSR